jgi:hypothetical protein
MWTPLLAFADSDSIKYSIEGEMSLESKNNYLGDQRDNNRPMIQNFALAMGLGFNSDLFAYIEVLGEQELDDTNVYFGQFYLDYKFIQGLSVKAGNMYYNFGLMTSDEGLLSQRPDYYADLLVTRRGLDVGLSANWQPITDLPISISYAYFSGRTLRVGDHKVERPDVEPQYIQLLYTPSWAELRLTHLQRQFVNRPKLKAYGLDFKSQDLCYHSLWVCWQPGFELWSFDYDRIDGNRHQGLTGAFASKLSVWNFFYRFIISEENWKNSSSPFGHTKSYFQLNGFGYQVNKYIHLEYQNIRATESGANNWSMPIANEDVYRIFLQF